MEVKRYKDYGFRVAVDICLNPDEPQYIHRDSTPHDVANINGCPYSIDPVTGKETDKVPGCVNNWRMVYLTWTDGELMTVDPQGKPRRKSTDEILAEAKAKAIATEQPTPITPDNVVGTRL